MNARELIEKKKRGAALTEEEIGELVDGYVAGRIPDYQMAAFLMAVWFRGLSIPETRALLDRMMRSGRVIDLADIPGPKIDKHSTGGVGDKVSLPLVGVAAACGLRVPMISGRGLGHTGGTLDKLESIPGYDVRFDESRYRRSLRTIGATIVGQSTDLVPADRELYALRDVTATVDCVPLIVASILSKKFASGADGVVVDVKVGSGAFMRDLAAARRLAELLVEMGAAFGRRVSVCFTRMDEPLGIAVGNAVEVIESVDLLRGAGPEDLRELVLELVGDMLVLGDLAADGAEGRQTAGRALASGEALERFRRMVEAHGGRLDLDRPDCGLEVAPRAAVVTAPQDAWLAAVDGYQVGMTVVDLRGGRQRKEDPVDPSVGVRWLARIGQRVGRGEPVAEVLARPDAPLGGAVARLAGAVAWSDKPVAVPERILGRIPWARSTSDQPGGAS
jgi:pyrimidine-nucleoside phosphorylase